MTAPAGCLHLLGFACGAPVRPCVVGRPAPICRSTVHPPPTDDVRPPFALQSSTVGPPSAAPSSGSGHPARASVRRRAPARPSAAQPATSAHSDSVAVRHSQPDGLYSNFHPHPLLHTPLG
uniref:Secreted protein n=1 Tax=Zea mays TaxID=4577 RepID=A0A804LKE0_MAIZE